MRLSRFSMPYVAILAGFVALTLLFSWNSVAQEGKSSLSGRVVDIKGKPVAGLELAIKPVEIKEPRDMVPRTPFSDWLRVVTDKEGRFSFRNIDAVSSQFVMFPESASDFEIISLEIGDLTFYSTAFLRHFPTWFGKLTFTIEPGTHLQNVVVNVKPPRMRIRGRVLLKDGTPLANTDIGITVRRRQRETTLFILPSGGSAGSSGGGTRTDAEGYFVSYYPDETSEYSVIVKCDGASAKSRWFRLKEGQRNDKLVLVLKDLEEHRVSRGLSAMSEPFTVEAGKPHETVVLTLNGDLADLSELSSERPEGQRHNLPNVLGVWIVNPANGHAYKKIACDDWEDAQDQAAGEEAHLVTITNEAEQIWLEAIFGPGPYWIGLTDVLKEGEWIWETGEPVTYTNWIEDDEDEDLLGEPPVLFKAFGAKNRRQHQKQDEEDYVMMSPRWEGEIGKWYPANSKSARRRGRVQMAILEKDGMRSKVHGLPLSDITPEDN